MIRPGTRGLVVTAWVAVGLVGHLLDGTHHHESAQAVFAAGALALGAWVFWTHGGHQVTALGLFGLGIAVFTGYAGLYWLGQPQAISASLLLATAAGYWVLLAVYLVAGRRDDPYSLVQVDAHEVTGWALTVGLVVSMAGLALMRQVAGVSTFVALAGVGVFIAALMLHRHARAKVSVRIMAAAAVVAVLTTQFFSAYGRLMIVTIGLVAVVLGSSLTSKRRAKALALAAIAPATLWLVQFRETAQRSLGYQEHQVDGLGSATTPLATFARLIESDMSGANGEPFLASLLFWIPRSIWPEKPNGLGSQLTAQLEPELLPSGHSMAAQSMGEWFFSWGWIGVVALVPVLALALRLLDNALRRALAQPIADRYRFLRLAVVVFLVSEVPVLAWSGSFTYSTRAGVKVAVGVALLVLFGSRRKTAVTTGASPEFAGHRATG